MTSFSDYDESRTDIPSFTCGQINDLQRELRRLARDLSTEVTEDADVARFMSNIAGELEDLADEGRYWREKPVLERLRESNDALRQAVKYWRDAAESISAEADKLRERVEELEYDMEMNNESA